MEVNKTNFGGKKTTSVLDLTDDLAGVPKKDQRQVKEEIKEYIKEQVLLSVGSRTSPIQGEGAFAKLSKEYAKTKQKFAGNVNPNLELTGKMLNKFDTRVVSEGIEIGVFDDKLQAAKADGHSNLSGASRFVKKKQRHFIPNKGQSLNDKIENGITDIISEFIVEDVKIDASEIRDLESKSAFEDMLGEKFPAISVVEAKQVIKASPFWVNILDEIGHLAWLR